MRTPLEPAIGRAGELAVKLFTSPQIESLIMKAGLNRFQPPPQSGAQRYGKGSLVTGTLHAAQRAAANGDEQVEEDLKEFLRLVAERAHGDDLTWLREAVRAGGFDLQVDPGPVRLLPLDDPDVPLSDAVTALEADFVRLGWMTAKTLYRQAVDSLLDQRYEAANQGMRAMFEEVIVQAAVQNGYNRKQQGDAGGALNYMIEGHELLPEQDGGWYIRGLWKIVQTNGPHPGTTTAGEAQFRVQAMTAASRYLIDRFALVAL